MCVRGTWCADTHDKPTTHHTTQVGLPNTTVASYPGVWPCCDLYQKDLEGRAAVRAAGPHAVHPHAAHFPSHSVHG